MIVNESDDIDGYIYCTGKFTEVNNRSVGHIWAIIKKARVFIYSK